MDKRDQELLDKQLWGVGPTGAIVGFIIVFLVGLCIGDILSKTRQADPVLASIDFAALTLS